MTPLYDQNPDIVDITRLEQDARRLRAAYLQAGIRKGWARLATLFQPAPHAQNDGTSKA
ncbi:RSP_7527 family protein [Roseinatronobacter sp.]|uniref:RSP_7527 family protein n=1 Tax=Roseinatronobacter sp. TaxID=1945755 RepID=UPI003F6FEA39